MNKKYEFDITGIDCAGCAIGIKRGVLKLKGISAAELAIETSILTVQAEEGLDPDLVELEVSKLGYKAYQRMEGLTVTLFIEGLDCPDEGAVIGKKLKGLTGIQNFQINLIKGSIDINYDPASVSVQDIMKSIAETGLKASRALAKKQHEESWWKKNQIIFLGICGAFLGIAFIMEKFGFPELVTKFMYALSILTGGYYPAKLGFMALRTFTLNIRLLMVFGAAGAILLGFWDEAAMLVFIYSLGDVLEAYATNKARGSIRNLMALVPQDALLKREEQETRIPVEEVRINDIIIIKPGEKIPLDGRVLHGSSSVDESPITGESMPADKNKNSEVFAGSINQRGSLEVKVTKLSKDTTLAKIIHSVEEAQARKSTYQRFGEKFGIYYTPIMFMFALTLIIVPPLVLGQPFSGWIYRGLVLLVVSCSCGIALSVPVSVVAAIGNAAHHGIMVKGGASLEAASEIKVVAFDKTGTLTIGKPKLREIISLNSVSPDQILQIAFSLESRSEHPIAEAILREAKERGVKKSAVNEFQTITGMGAQGYINGQLYLIGSRRLFDQRGIPIVNASFELDRLQSEGKTTIILGTDKEILGVMAIADQLRLEAKKAVHKLKNMGMMVVMLTGDNPGTAKAIAEEADIDYFKAGLLPEDKVTIVKELKNSYGKTCFIGDGINDAPAMAEANVGISMGGSGTDVAIETGDFSLMADDLMKLPYALAISKRAVFTIKQNIFASLAIVVFLVPAGAMGLVSLVPGLLINEVSALVVIVNGLKLLKDNFV